MNQMGSHSASFLPLVLHKLPEHLSVPKAEPNPRSAAINKKNMPLTPQSLDLEPASQSTLCPAHGSPSKMGGYCRFNYTMP